MSFGRFPRFEDDPFFSSSFPTFPSFPMLGFPALESPHERNLRGRDRQHHRHNGQQLGLMDPFSMFNNMEQMMNVTGNARPSGNGHYFSSSSVMHYSTNGGKEPEVYHATSSVTSGPGGIKETRKTECDSRSGTKKMAIGHHIGERSHTIERRENTRTKEQEQHQHFINLDEDEAGHFDQEWRQKTSTLSSGLHSSDPHARRRGIGGVSDIPRPRPGYRDHRSRSPEKGMHGVSNQSHHLSAVHADGRTERRQALYDGRTERRQTPYVDSRIERRPTPYADDGTERRQTGYADGGTERRQTVRADGGTERRQSVHAGSGTEKRQEYPRQRAQRAHEKKVRF